MDSSQDYSQEQTNLNIMATLSDIQSHKKLTDAELSNLKLRIESFASTVKEQIGNLEKNVLEVRDKARDAMHISVGVDGKNGLRGSMETMLREVTSMSEDFAVLRQTAQNYNETKDFLLRLFVSSAVAMFIQFGGAIWFLSSMHNKQENMREDLNKVISYVDKKHAEQLNMAQSKP
jgi:hypothetical protein